MRLSGATRLAAVIGSPVRHSLSPAIHNAAFAAAGLDWAFVALEVAPGDAGRAIDGMRALGLGGLSVTMPHKEAAAGLVDERSAEAEVLGAVNCVIPVDGRLRGDNTDGEGFVAALRDDHGLTVDGLRCGVLGAGGAGRAVALALASSGAAEVLVVNRSVERAAAAVALLGGRGRVGEAAELARVDLLVNATPIGMGDGGGMPVDGSVLGGGQIVADLVYQPLETPLLAAARAAGATVVDGLGMLVHQAALAFTRWTGEPAPVGAMAEAARLEAARAVNRAISTTD